MSTPEMKKDDSAEAHGKCMMSRRQFLMTGSAVVVSASTISITLFPGTAEAQQTEAEVLSYPRKHIGKLSQLKDNKPIDFNYPDNGKNSQAMLVKMDGAQSGGGIGPKRDVVAFSYLCTHQGGNLKYTAMGDSGYKAVGDQRVLGQCPLHLSTYDLRRHGIIVSGQAYQSIPQVLLELDGDDIYAVGIMGLLFGRNNNVKGG